MSSPDSVLQQLLSAYHDLSDSLDSLSFGGLVDTVYNPLSYAWAPFEEFHRRYATTRVCTLFLGMNPGPFGMVQTGIPFGDPEFVRNWLRIRAEVHHPEKTHPKRPVVGLGSDRREVSGSRLWGLFRDRFETPDAFFEDHYVANYCPLAFVGETGRNLTPDKLPVDERRQIYHRCDAALSTAVETLQPSYVVGIGRFAEERLKATLGEKDTAPIVLRVLHPSPASPAANKGWAENVTATLEAAGVW